MVLQTQLQAVLPRVARIPQQHPVQAVVFLLA